MKYRVKVSATATVEWEDYIEADSAEESEEKALAESEFQGCHWECVDVVGGSEVVTVKEPQP